MGGTRGRRLDEDTAFLCNYVTLFLDVLDQRRELLKIKIPTSPAETEPTMLALQKTAGRIIKLRENFDALFAGFDTPTEILDDLPPRERARALEMRKGKVHAQSASDALIFTVSLMSTGTDPRPISGVFRALYAAAALFPLALADEIVLRGGIDVGPGIEIAKDEIYGPGLVRAYTLESQHARYPRILVGREMVRFLAAAAQPVSQSPEGEYARKMAVECQQLIDVDPTDGLPIIDYLGPAMSDDEAYRESVRPAIEQAYKLVAHWRYHWASKENPTLAAKYGSIRSYFEHRIANWGIERLPANWTPPDENS